MSRGQLPFSWYVSEERVSWAIKHVSEKYRCDVQEVIVFEVVERLKAYFFIAPMPDCYRCGLLLRPNAVYPAYNWFPKEN